MPTKADYEPYFERWNSVLFFPRPGEKETDIILAGHSGDGGSVPCFQHKTCEGLIKVTTSWKPPRVCVWCKVDTVKEQAEIEERGDNSGERTPAVLLP